MACHLLSVILSVWLVRSCPCKEACNLHLASLQSTDHPWRHAWLTCAHMISQFTRSTLWHLPAVPCSIGNTATVAVCRYISNANTECPGAGGTVVPLCDNDGVCDAASGETITNCPADCSPSNGSNNSKCGDGICSVSLGENCVNCRTGETCTTFVAADLCLVCACRLDPEPGAAAGAPAVACSFTWYAAMHLRAECLCHSL